MSPLHSVPQEPETEQRATHETAATEPHASSNFPAMSTSSPASDSDTAVVSTATACSLDSPVETAQPATVAPEQSAHSPDSALPTNTDTEQTSDTAIGQANMHALLDAETPTMATEPLPTISPIHELGRGLQTKNIPAKLQNYVLQTITPFVFRSSKVPYALEFYVDCSRFSESHCHFLSAISSFKEPTSYRQAILDEIWRNSIQDEYVALEENGTWIVVDLPPDKHALSCKWIFKYKFRADGTLECPKSRLVVCGNSQVEGEDYEETFVSVAKMTMVRTFLQIAASRNWEIHQMDVHNVFLSR